VKPAKSRNPAGATEAWRPAKPEETPGQMLPEMTEDLPVAGETVNIGPECFAAKNEKVICWKGRNYVLQDGERVHICGDGCTERHDYAEGPEAAARRYAQQLLSLQDGMRQRDYNLSSVCEGHLVQFVLDALDDKDEEHEAAQEFNLEAVTHAFAEEELMADLVAAMVRQERGNPMGLVATRSGLRLVLADIEDMWVEAHREWKSPDGTSRTGSLLQKALEMAAFSMRLARAVRAMNGEPG